MICHYCKKDPGTKPHSAVVWNGFYDQDMQLHVCYKCQARHYLVKRNTEHAHKYSEFPVVIAPAQLSIFNG